MLAVIRSILMQQLHRGEDHKGRQISDLKEVDTLMGGILVSYYYDISP